MNDILKARENLSLKYKSLNRHESQIVNSNNEITAYLLSRLPATFAVISNVLNRFDLSSCQSLLDLGSGPGTVSFAVAENIPNVEIMTLLEQEKSFMDKFNLISSFSDNDILKTSKKYIRDIKNFNNIDNHDLVTISYVLNELDKNKQENLLKKAIDKADKFIIIIETGTPEGFKNIINARDVLIQSGLNIVAPCPHNNQCPLIENNDWCHFSQRVERSSYHKFLKLGSESFEDEKFSYVIASKDVLSVNSNPRIIRHPQVHKGHIDLKLCTVDGIEEKIFSKKDDEYKSIKKLDWGDSVFS